MKRSSRNGTIGTIIVVLSIIVALFGWNENKNNVVHNAETVVNIAEIPDYSDNPYVIINDNNPVFSEDELTTEAYENYSTLDEFGRCQAAIASCGNELMPTIERGDISEIYPSGWEQEYYSFVDGSYIYNRCHLLGWQLTGEDANESNLITGTRYMNTEGMLPFENMIADYIKETNNHVAYRVTPIYEDENLVASGVQLEAYSIEDEGEGICFNVYCYNVQPGIKIDYATGQNWEENSNISIDTDEEGNYVLNNNNKKFHKSDCNSVNDMKEENKSYFNGSRDELIKKGFEPCGSCKP